MSIVFLFFGETSFFLCNILCICENHASEYDRNLMSAIKNSTFFFTKFCTETKKKLNKNLIIKFTWKIRCIVRLPRTIFIPCLFLSQFSVKLKLEAAIVASNFGVLVIWCLLQFVAFACLLFARLLFSLLLSILLSIFASPWHLLHLCSSIRRWNCVCVCVCVFFLL